jgi:hypothetical protein
MSIIYCEKHDLHWDSDFLEECPQCENEHPEEADEKLDDPRHEYFIGWRKDGTL